MEYIAVVSNPAEEETTRKELETYYHKKLGWTDVKITIVQTMKEAAKTVID